MTKSSCVELRSNHVHPNRRHVDHIIVILILTMITVHVLAVILILAMIIIVLASALFR